VLFTSFDPTREFDRVARRAFGAGHWTAVRSAMPMDVIRGKDDVQIRFDLPGVDPESIDVTVDRGVLSVSARRTEKTGEDEKLITRERVTGSVTRRLSLGDRPAAQGRDSHRQQEGDRCLTAEDRPAGPARCGVPGPQVFCS